jgi:hypothetical protein
VVGVLLGDKEMTQQEKAKQQAEVMLAYANGAEIESAVWEREHWLDCANPTWNWATSEFRVKKPVPKVVKLAAWMTVSGLVCFYREDARYNVPNGKRIPSLDMQYVEDES